MNILCADGTAIFRVGGIAVDLSPREAKRFKDAGIHFVLSGRLRFGYNAAEAIRRKSLNQHRSRCARRKKRQHAPPPPDMARGKLLIFDVTFPDGHVESLYNFRKFLAETLKVFPINANRSRRVSLERRIKRAIHENDGMLTTRRGVYKFSFKGLQCKDKQ